MIALDGSSLTLEQLVAIADHSEEVAIAATAFARVDAARRVVEQKAEGSESVYGINTGFGSLAEVRIPHEQLNRLQLNLLRSHAAGVDEPLTSRVVRATMALRANVLAKGYSGIRRETLAQLVALLNRRVHPWVPSRGSVGASGDLAPLAHVALVLVGEGRVLQETGAAPDASSATAVESLQTMAGAEALAAAGLQPVVLQAKEGLALINGTQPSTAVLALALADAMRLARAADIALALSLDGLRGSARPFEARIHEARPFAGQRDTAANVSKLLENSAINRSHQNCGKVQDAYSLRCAAQVHGAARDVVRFVRGTVEVEANAGTDNPMVFAETSDIVSGGNFHGAPVALAADFLSIAMTQFASISERRCDRLLNAALSDLPPFLTTESGVQSGLMVVQITAAALTSELKSLAHPASVDTIPTSAGREDHVSMSMGAALKAARVVELARKVLASEVLCACQAIDLLRPLTTSPPLERVHRAVRQLVPVLVEDRPPSPDISSIDQLIASGELERACGMEVK